MVITARGRDRRREAIDRHEESYGISYLDALDLGLVEVGDVAQPEPPKTRHTPFRFLPSAAVEYWRMREIRDVLRLTKAHRRIGIGSFDDW